MTQAQLEFHNMISHITQEQIDLQNQLEMYTKDLITKPILTILLFSFLIITKLPTFLQILPTYLQMIKWNINIYLQKIKPL